MSERLVTTAWSQVLAARDGSDSEVRAALEALCGTYWEPLYAFVRRRGVDPDSAADLSDSQRPTRFCSRSFGCGSVAELGDALDFQQPRVYEVGLRIEFQ